MHQIKIIIRSLFLLVLLLLSPSVSTVSSISLRPNYDYGVIVLMYHHVHDIEKSTNTISTNLFQSQLSYLKQKGYHFISLEEFRQYLQGKDIPANAILVTFDDGYESFYQYAIPILQQLQIPSVNFIITQRLIDMTNLHVTPMSKRQVKNLLNMSPRVDIQCHTHNMHQKLNHNYQTGCPSDLSFYKTTTGLDTQCIFKDITTCRTQLQQFQDRPVDSFAYPYGVNYPMIIHNIYKAGIRYAFTTKAGIVTRFTNHMKIPRINAGNPNIAPEELHHCIMRYYNMF